MDGKAIKTFYIDVKWRVDKFKKEALSEVGKTKNDLKGIFSEYGKKGPIGEGLKKNIIESRRRQKNPSFRMFGALGSVIGTIVAGAVIKGLKELESTLERIASRQISNQAVASTTGIGIGTKALKNIVTAQGGSLNGINRVSSLGMQAPYNLANSLKLQRLGASFRAERVGGSAGNQVGNFLQSHAFSGFSGRQLITEILKSVDKNGAKVPQFQAILQKMGQNPTSAYNTATALMPYAKDPGKLFKSLKPTQNGYQVAVSRDFMSSTAKLSTDFEALANVVSADLMPALRAFVDLIDSAVNATSSVRNIVNKVSLPSLADRAIGASVVGYDKASRALENVWDRAEQALSPPAGRKTSFSFGNGMISMRNNPFGTVK